MAMAMWGMGLMVAPIAGPTLGGWITDNLNWRWNFYINIPIGIDRLRDGLDFCSRSPLSARARAKGGKVDYAGIVLLVLSLGLPRSCWTAVSAPIGSPRTGWSGRRCCRQSSRFCWSSSELTFSDPIIDLRILKQSSFSHLG